MTRDLTERQQHTQGLRELADFLERDDAPLAPISFGYTIHMALTDALAAAHRLGLERQDRGAGRYATWTRRFHATSYSVQAEMPLDLDDKLIDHVERAIRRELTADERARLGIVTPTPEALVPWELSDDVRAMHEEW